MIVPDEIWKLGQARHIARLERNFIEVDKISLAAGQFMRWIFKVADHWSSKELRLQQPATQTKERSYSATQRSV